MERTIDIPEKVDIRKEKDLIVVTGPKGELKKVIHNPLISLEVKGKIVVIKSVNEKRKSLAMAGTAAAHIRNMVAGVTSGYEAKMKIVYSHFPIKVKVESGSVIIQNFMGERDSRKAEIVEGVKVDVKKEELLISGIDREAVGQTAGRIEIVTRVTGYDRRVFQDGIFLTEKSHPSAGGRPLPASE